MGMTIKQLRHGPWTPGNSLQKLNELIDAVNGLYSYVGWNLNPAVIGPVKPEPRPFNLDVFFGEITTTPCSSSGSPSGGSDYTDARYYVTRCVCPDPNSPTDNYSTMGALTDVLTNGPDPFNGHLPLPSCVTATNLCELPATVGDAGTHQLAAGLIVFVIGVPDRQNPVKRTYFFTQAIAGPIAVTLASDGGSAGSNAPSPAASTLTYTVTIAEGGKQLGTTVPVWPARQIGHVTAATKGYAQKISGTLYVVQHDEVLDTSGCS
jgi:hypothetical protein